MRKEIPKKQTGILDTTLDLFQAERFEEVVDTLSVVCASTEVAEDSLTLFRLYGHSLLVMERSSEAIRVFQTILSSLERSGGENRTEYVATLDLLGRGFMDVGAPADAIETIKRAVSSSRSIFGSFNGHTARLLARLARMYEMEEYWILAAETMGEAAEVAAICDNMTESERHNLQEFAQKASRDLVRFSAQSRREASVQNTSPEVEVPNNLLMSLQNRDLKQIAVDQIADLLDVTFPSVSMGNQEVIRGLYQLSLTLIEAEKSDLALDVLVSLETWAVRTVRSLEEPELAALVLEQLSFTYMDQEVYHRGLAGFKLLDETVHRINAPMWQKVHGRCSVAEVLATMKRFRPALESVISFLSESDLTEISQEDQLKMKDMIVRYRQELGYKQPTIFEIDPHRT
jgi:hypothetical protein